MELLRDGEVIRSTSHDLGELCNVGVHQVRSGPIDQVKVTITRNDSAVYQGNWESGTGLHAERAGGYYSQIKLSSQAPYLSHFTI
uniref:hypothetical protein n=1 Tax=Thaumasiovibrio occultus TaxID=1891184 RepID=UPI00131B0D29|nr:hypothetical protein [Thaumasiovibrio occultus]